MGRDITERKRTEKLVELGKIASILAHEIRNPLTSIKMRIYAFGKESVTEDQKEDIQVITQEIDRLTETTQKFLDFTKTSRVQFESVQISAPIESALKTLQPKIKQKNILVRINYKPKSHFVEIDPSQVEQLFLNLFLNAIDAMPNGGELKISTALTSIPNRGAGLQVEVTDSGEGMDKKTLARIFDPFFTTKIYGYGLGLPTVARTMELHEGQVKVESQKGKGTKFTLTFPCLHTRIRDRS